MVDRLITIPLLAVQTLCAGEPSAAMPAAGEFVAGPENSLATDVIRACLNRSWGRYSPILLYGSPGSGKTHLAQGLADWWQRHFPTAAVAYLSAGEFAQAFGAAVGADRLPRWRRRMHELDLLVLDDINQLAGKASAQQELRQLLDVLAERDALVVITNRTLPTALRSLASGLRGRLSSGLAVPLALPERETRRTLWERFAASRSWTISDKALLSLADGLNLSIPALVAAMADFERSAATQRRPIDLAAARRFVNQRNNSHMPELGEIAGQAASYFGLKLSDLKSPLRRQPIVAARSMSMYLARQLTKSSLEQIGAYFGGRDHSTVLHGCRRTEELLRRDRATRQAVAELKRRLVAT